MSQLPIRPFDRQTDFKRVKDFFDNMGGESRGFFNRGGGNGQNALRFFDPNDKINEEYAFFMALDGEKMAGYVFLWDISKSVVWLGVAVSDDWKGRHLGRDLMACAEEYARSKNKGGIMLTTSQGNVRGQGLYTRCGYELIGVHTSGELLFIKRF